MELRSRATALLIILLILTGLCPLAVLAETEVPDGTIKLEMQVDTAKGAAPKASIKLNLSNLTVARKQSAGLTAKTAGDTGSLVWISSNPYVAKVSSKGTVTGVSAGSCTVICYSRKNPSVRAACTVKVLLGRWETVYLAHMGYSSIAPENSLAAIQLAARAGFTGTEFDIYESKKEKKKRYRPYIILSHDKTLTRLTGK